MFIGFPNIEINRFLILIKYLDGNYLTQCLYSKQTGEISFTYRDYNLIRDVNGYATDLNREVIIAESKEYVEIIRKNYQVLDRYKNLYLVASKDAEIWEFK